jgi:hypothetical protein
MQFYCVGHRPLLFDPGRDFTWVSPERFDDRPTLVVPDDHFGPAWDGRILSEYTQLFALADKLAVTDPSEVILLFQYRKFVSLRPSLQRSTSHPIAFVASGSEATGLFLTDTELAQRDGRILVGPLLPVGSTAHQYAVAHHADDFARFCLTLSGLEGFDVARCGSLASHPFLVPSPALGLFSAGIFIRHMAILREAWAAFYERFYVPREGYQRRVGGFLLERLHSFLLLDEAQRGDYVLVPGHQIVISDTPDITITL